MTQLCQNFPVPKALPKPSFSVIIPTLNEAENVEPLLDRVLAKVRETGLPAEIIVVDGGSTDETCQRVLEHSPAVRLIRSSGQGGLSGDIMRGANEAESEIVLVMDADLSHPPESIAELLTPILNDEQDMVIGSRYVSGGSTPDWPWIRRLASKSATWLAWPLVSVRDPMSGFFAVRRSQMLQLGQEAAGFKIGLEILTRGEDQLRVLEVPITFIDRERGESKLGLRETLDYFRQLIALAGGSISTGHATRFAVVGGAGMIVDFILFNLMLALSFGLVAAHIVSFAVATFFNYTLNSRWAFANAYCGNKLVGWQSYTKFLVVCLLALFIRGAMLSSLVQDFHWPPEAAIFLAIAGAASVNFIGTAFFVFPNSGFRATSSIRWRILALCVAAYMLVLRGLFSGVVELMPQESYYWVYSQNLDYGYLDHPPLVAWLIWLSTQLLGKEETAVRLPAIVCWMITAFFVFRTTVNVYDKTAAFRSLLLLSILPIYAVVGIMMTPDAPLIAAWAGCLYFLERALIAGRGNAWLGVGICMGVGMLAKYTIALLAPAILVYLIVNRSSRVWLRRPQPYMAALIAVLLFSPVLIWNANNDWASFQFQGTRRWSGTTGISLHELLGSVLLLLTPLGAVTILSSLMRRRSDEVEAGQSGSHAAHQNFAQIFTAVPLVVFVLQSFRNDSQLNWTGPLWLAAVPLLAYNMTSIPGKLRTRVSQLLEMLWKPSIAALLLFYGTSLYYIQLGFPGFPPQIGMPFPIAWKSLAEQIERLSDETSDGQAVVAGVDRYKISSAFAFYDPDNDGLTHTSGCHLLGGESVMWEYWKPSAETEGQDVILVSFKPEMLLSNELSKRFARTSPITLSPIQKNGLIVGHFYYRVGHGYHSPDRDGLVERPKYRQASNPNEVSNPTL